MLSASDWYGWGLKPLKKKQKHHIPQDENLYAALQSSHNKDEKHKWQQLALQICPHQ